MTKMFLFFAVLPVWAEPILNVPADFELQMPGVIPNLDDLYTFVPRGSAPPSFATCGQIGFVPTLEDGSPDPSGVLGFIQINTPCAKLTEDSPTVLGHSDSSEISEVPEPATGLLVLLGIAVAAIRSVSGRGIRLVDMIRLGGRNPARYPERPHVERAAYRAGSEGQR